MILFKALIVGVAVLATTAMTVAVKNHVTKYAAEATLMRDLSQFVGTEVRFRVEEGDVLTGTGNLRTDGVIYTSDSSGTLGLQLLDPVASGQKLYFSVAPQPSDVIDLDGAKEVVADMVERLKRLAP